MLAPLARGTMFLSALVITTFAFMLMSDGAIEEMYGLAFGPIYLFQLVVFIDLFLPAYIPSTDDMSIYRQAPKETRYAKCSAGLNYVIWLIITILVPMRLSEFDTVPTSSIGALFLLWLALVMLAQHTEKRNWQVLQPFLLRRMADYFSVIHPSDNFDFDNVLSDASSDPIERVSEFDAGSEFGEQRGTVRGMSVRDSLRGSPPPTEADLSVLDDVSTLDLHDAKGKGKQVVVQIDQRESEIEAAGLETMARDDITLEEAIMK
jgi:hypothetical protein